MVGSRAPGSLRDIGELEQYIAQSNAINYYLSFGYFKSKNCLREVQATVDEQKPCMCTLECDRAKGGGPLEEIKLELDD